MPSTCLKYYHNIKKEGVNALLFDFLTIKIDLNQKKHKNYFNISKNY